MEAVSHVGLPSQNQPPASPPIPEDSRHTPSSLQHVLFVAGNYFRYIVSKSLIIILTVYSFFALWESILFAMIEYPELQQLYSAGKLTSYELDHALAGAILRVLATVMSTILAIRLTTAQEKVSHTVDILVTTGLILGHNYLMEYLLSHNIVQLLRQTLQF